MFDNTAASLHAAIAAVCPIHGVSIGRKDDKATWRIDFADEATQQQKSAAQNALVAFDVVAAKAARDADVAKAAAKQAKLEALAAALEADPALLDKLTNIASAPAK